MKIVVMSIQPRYSRRIFEGEKRFELRRTPVKVSTGDVVVVYESAPRKAIVGAFVVGDVHRGGVSCLWRDLGTEFGVTDEEYRAYFDGAEKAHAIEVSKVVEVDPVPLEKLRKRFDGFRPPQSYMFWKDALPRLIGRTAARAITVASA